MALKIELPENKHTKYEKARIIGARAMQIAAGAPLLIKLSQKELEKIKYSPLQIAKMEYAQDKIPISVKRIFPHEWKY